MIKMTVDVSIPKIEAKLPIAPVTVEPIESTQPTIVDFCSCYESEDAV
jgi:hypothetical protein